MPKRTSVSKRAELTKLERECNSVRRRINALRNEIYGDPIPVRNPPFPEPDHAFVTDHAVVRYLERVHRLDLDPIRRKIVTPDVLSAINAGAEHVVQKGFVLGLRGRVVLTVLTEDMVDV